MARKGSKKVRTGCITCKVRKVKCDETKPSCRRCTSTGRICDGYSPWGRATPATHLTLIYKRSGTTEEQRGLQYFCEVAAPYLLGPKNPCFWTHLVMQLSESEPVVKHSLLAISSLYENREVQRTSPAPPNLALRHYTAAIRELKTTQSDVLALVGCVSFTCIELLRSNYRTAIWHCTNGIAILEHCDSLWAREHLDPIFRRIRILPLLLSSDSTEPSRPMVLGFVTPSKFDSLDDAQLMTNEIINRLKRLCSLKKQGLQFDQDMEREYIKSLLERWQFLIKGIHVHAALQVDSAYNAQYASALMHFQLCQACFNFLFYSSMGDDENAKASCDMVESALSFSELHTLQSTWFLSELGLARPVNRSDGMQLSGTTINGASTADYTGYYGRGDSRHPAYAYYGLEAASVLR